MSWKHSLWFYFHRFFYVFFFYPVLHILPLLYFHESSNFKLIHIFIFSFLLYFLHHLHQLSHFSSPSPVPLFSFLFSILFFHRFSSSHTPSVLPYSLSFFFKWRRTVFYLSKKSPVNLLNVRVRMIHSNDAKSALQESPLASSPGSARLYQS